MKIDDLEVPSAVISSWKSAFDRVAEPQLAELSRKHTGLATGFRPGKLPAREVRSRVKSSLDTLPGLPEDYRLLLAGATLSQSLLGVLSEKALDSTAAKLAQAFGCREALASMLLDERGSVRQLGFRLIQGWDGEEAAPQEIDSAKAQLRQELQPFLSHVVDLLSGVDPQADSAAPATELPARRRERSAHQRDALSRLRAERKFSRQLAREKSTAQAAFNLQQARADSLEYQLQETQGRAVHLQSDLTALKQAFDQRVEQEVQAQLDSRLRPWLVPAERLSRDVQDLAAEDVLEQAEQLLAQQAQVDARYGLISKLKAELDRATTVLTRLRLAQVDSLQPIGGLDLMAERLEAHRQTLFATLGLHQQIDRPKNPTIVRLATALSSARTLDEVAAVREGLSSAESVGLLSPEEAAEAYTLIHEATSKVYDRHLVASPQGGATQSLIRMPLFALLAELARRQPCTLVIDGHNVLHKLPALFRPDYEAGLPGPRARRALESRLVELGCRSPELTVHLCFDGPLMEDRTAGQNVRVYFSGGTGADRADRQILAYLRHACTADFRDRVAVVSADGEVAKGAVALGAMVMAPQELAVWLSW